ncbi:MAG: hypothetical protein ACTSYI_17040 [Promethearchaeota archaeon]
MFKKRGTKKQNKVEKDELVLSALGVMQDETNRPVSTDDISFCLQIDFKQKMKEAQVVELLQESKTKGFCSVSDQGWKLTLSGEQVVDSCLENISN